MNRKADQTCGEGVLRRSVAAWVLGAALAAPAAVPAEPAKAAMCGGCHGADGNSPTVESPSLAGQHSRYLADATVSYRDGRRPHSTMKALVAGLSERDVVELAEFYAGQPLRPASFPKAKALSTGDRALASAHSCAGCHGNDGNSLSPANPRLVGLSEQYQLGSLKAYRDGTRASGPMRALVAPMTDAELANLAAFYGVTASRE